MVTEELLAYIKRQQANHVPEESIRAILLSNGWLKVDVDKAFDSLFKVQESSVVTAKDLRSKIASFAPVTKSQPVFQSEQQSKDSLSQNTQVSSLVNDSYREPIDDTPKEKFTSQSMGVSIGKNLPEDLKDRLRKISSGSIFAPQKDIVNPITSTSSVSTNPLLANNTQSVPTFEERLMSQESQSSSTFPIKRETIASQPASALHMIEDKPLVAPQADQNRLYSNFKGGSPYSPSMDKFNNPIMSAPVRKSYFGRVIAFVLFIGVMGTGIYLYTQKPDMVRTVIDTLMSRFTQESQMVIVDTPTTPKDSPVVDTNSPQDTQGTIIKEETTNTPKEPTLPSAESSLKSIALKIPAYVGTKSTTKGVCSNITSGVAKDVITLRQTYGQSVTCVDDVSGFAIAVPYQTTGEYMCIDATQEIILIKTLPKSARCI